MARPNKSTSIRGPVALSMGRRLRVSDNVGSKNDDTESVTSMNSTPKASLSRLVSLARPEYPALAVAVVLAISSEAILMYNPLLLASAFNYLIDPSVDNSARMTKINTTMGMVLTLHITSLFLYFGRESLLRIIGERVVARVRTTLYQSLLRQEIAFFDQHKSGELISRLSSDTTLLQQGTSQSLPEICAGIIKGIIAITIMFWITPKLAVFMIAFVVIVMCICVPFGTKLGCLSKDYQNVLGIASGFTAETLQAMRTVHSFSAENKEFIRYQSRIGNPFSYKYWYPKSTIPGEVETTYQIGFFKAILAAAFFAIIFGLGFSGMYCCLWYGFKLVIDGEITFGDLTAFQLYVFTIGSVLGQMSQEITKLVEAQGVAGRIYLLERVPLIPTPTEDETNHRTVEATESSVDMLAANLIGKIDAEAGDVVVKSFDMEGSIDFNNVNFSYPSRPGAKVLHNFSLSVPARQTCALVGASGSGKSTCISLLQRFYDVTDGSITIDGYDIRQLHLQWFRSNMALVQQEPQLFGISIRDNILYGVKDIGHVTDDDIVEVAKIANAHEFISKWPNGYDTLIGERGVKLSGGQKQRIAIARALMRKPRILLLDEATSALDAESEHLVQEAIDKAIVGRTVLIVAHRLSTIQRAQQIVVIDEHRIVDVGTHKELLNRCTKYQELIKRQAIFTSTDVN